MLDKFCICHKICTYSKEKYGLFYKIYLKISKENYNKFSQLDLFCNSVVSKGYNVGKLKKEVLNIQMTKRNYF